MANANLKPQSAIRDLLLQRFLKVITVSGPPYLLMTLMFETLWGFSGVLTAYLCAMSAWVWRWRGRNYVASHCATWSLWFAVAHNIWFTGGSHSPVMLWFAPASLLAIFLLGRGWGLAAVLGAVLYISFIVLIEKLAPNLIRNDLGSGLLAETYSYLSVCLPLLVSASFGYLTMWQYEQARSALDDSQRWFRGIIDSLPVGVLIENQDGLIVQGNREAQRIVGVDLEALQGAAATDILGIQNSELARSIAEDGQDIDVTRPGQQCLPVHLNAAKLEGFDQFTIISLANRSQQKKLEREVKEKEAKAIVAARLASLGEMAGGIAHEINNPLAIITGYTSRLTRLIHQDRYDPNQFIKLLGNIDRTSKRISQIINGLRIISRNSDGEGYEYQAMIQVVEDISGVLREV